MLLWRFPVSTTDLVPGILGLRSSRRGLAIAGLVLEALTLPAGDANAAPGTRLAGAASDALAAARWLT